MCNSKHCFLKFFSNRVPPNTIEPPLPTPQGSGVPTIEQRVPVAHPSSRGTRAQTASEMRSAPHARSSFGPIKWATIDWSSTSSRVEDDEPVSPRTSLGRNQRVGPSHSSAQTGSSGRALSYSNATAPGHLDPGHSIGPCLLNDSHLIRRDEFNTSHVREALVPPTPRANAWPPELLTPLPSPFRPQSAYDGSGWMYAPGTGRFGTYNEEVASFHENVFSSSGLVCGPPQSLPTHLLPWDEGTEARAKGIPARGVAGEEKHDANCYSKITGLRDFSWTPLAEDRDFTVLTASSDPYSSSTRPINCTDVDD